MCVCVCVCVCECVQKIQIKKIDRLSQRNTNIKRKCKKYTTKVVTKQRRWRQQSAGAQATPAAKAATMAATKAGAMRTQRNRDRETERRVKESGERQRKRAAADHVHRETGTVRERE